MAKNSYVYFCSECGYESSKWMGQCPGCKAWNTFVEEKLNITKISINIFTKIYHNKT